jgi:hypothetical protein
MMARGDWITPYRRGRGKCYKIARLMGDVQPWLELDARKILRRHVNRSLGRHLGRGAFGGGGGGEWIAGGLLMLLKSVFGLNRD